MKQYYYEINGIQTGPVTIEELKNVNISRNTLIWFEGLDNWIKAGEDEELREIFKSIPPPLNNSATPPPIAQVNIPSKNKTTLLDSTKAKVLIVCFATVVTVILFFSFSDNERTVIERQTIDNTQQISNQQNLIDEQNARIAEQERVEAERKAREEAEQKNLKIQALRAELDRAYSSLEASRRDFVKNSEFQLLRSRSEKQAQLNFIKSTIKEWEDEIFRIRGELTNLGVDTPKEEIVTEEVAPPASSFQ
ncbi:hypothetical protein FLJC2902T_17150 [Flavobacterium limnosediminis JC2902]|uniref:GYF domain-containing protein n=1 Tax=Flavobacterium limnosediminis JC2902 TaxID=1341181 RepID=V6SPJ6_9FLAO|nr:DUF4339 domain-containing protein [Flavobacterium limnosediminis]ESU28364.1 hypothetical protein FLJC2902T_17150 [Flavobacterium limnosediminis JC2902]